MADNTTGALTDLIERLRRNEPGARRALLDRACGRLQRLASVILHGSFPTLERRHSVDSVVHETWLRLVGALEQTQPPTLPDFFRLAAHKIRQVLLDLVEKERRLSARETPLDAAGSQGGLEPGTRTYDPARLTLWSEFHNKVAELPEDQRTVFEMHYYLDMPQAEIATALGLHPRKVSYLWMAATDALGEIAG